MASHPFSTDAKIIILEHPEKSMRFRYESEGRSARPILGEFSTDKKKTFPKIQIVGYTGKAKLTVSCVSHNKPYKPHPHKLIAKNDKNDYGDYMTEINGGVETILDGLSIQCVKIKDIDSSLKQREQRGVDPFGTGFDCRNKEKIDLSAVRLCFQAKIKPDGINEISLPAVVSNSIRKSNPDPEIIKISDTESPASGRKEILLFCEKVTKGNIVVHFYEEDDRGNIVWKVDIKEPEVHRQCGIAFQTPEYCKQDISAPVQTYLQLVRPNDGAKSTPILFQYIPCENDNQIKNAKQEPAYTKQVPKYSHRPERDINSKRQKPISFEYIPCDNKRDKRPKPEINQSSSITPFVPNIKTEMGYDRNVLQQNEYQRENGTQLHQPAIIENNNLINFDDYRTYPKNDNYLATGFSQPVGYPQQSNYALLNGADILNPYFPRYQNNVEHQGAAYANYNNFPIQINSPAYNLGNNCAYGPAKNDSMLTPLQPDPISTPYPNYRQQSQQIGYTNYPTPQLQTQPQNTFGNGINLPEQDTAFTNTDACNTFTSQIDEITFSFESIL